MSDLTGSRQKIRHPGPPAAQRQQFVRGEVRSFKVTLPTGAMLMAALTAALQDLQGETAFVPIDGLALRSGQHVLPADSPDAQHVAWYSETYRMGACRFVHGTVVLGRKDAQWFSHCHALWETAEGTQGLGHVLCAEACIAEPWEAEIHVFFGGGLRASHPRKTHESLPPKARQCRPLRTAHGPGLVCPQRSPTAHGNGKTIARLCGPRPQCHAQSGRRPSGRSRCTRPHAAHRANRPAARAGPSAMRGHRWAQTRFHPEGLATPP